MSSDWTRVREMFEASLDVAPEERAAFLDEQCGDDAVLRQQVVELLEADSADTTGGVAIEQPLPADLVEQDLTEAITGQQIGAYKIERVLGSGGMSTVFLAVQDHPRREVALKTMRAGLFSADTRRRFEFESEILGRLRHPAIAQVYEAGTWREPLAGQEVPYFALEYVKDAVPLDRYVGDNHLELDDALALFCEVCDAVSYGHQNGVIHRDLKPANVLVDSSGRPKIIDFGIARATESDVQGLSMLTQTGHVLGTLRYMAPEQLDGSRDVDTRIDVYALGVMLYEILAGEPLIDPGTLSITAFAKQVREMEPPLPSRTSGGFDLRGFARDLDWITRQAIATEKTERYAAVSELSADLRRFCANEPVSVGPPSTTYHLRKFVRRNRVLVGGIATAFVILVAGIITTNSQRILAEEAAATANREVVKAKTINEFFNDLLKFADPAEGRYRSRHDWTVRDALDAAAQLFPKLAHEPEAEAQARLSIGYAYKSLGQLEKAEENLQRAIDLRLQELGPDHPDVADAMMAMGSTLMSGDKYDEALEYCIRARAILEKRFGEDHERVAMSVLNSGTCLYRTNRLDEGEREIKRAIAIYRKQKPFPYRFIAVSLPFLGNMADARGESDEALRIWRESLEMYEKAGKSWHPYAANVHQSIAFALETKKRDHAGAEEHLRRALEINEGAWGPESKQVRETLRKLAGMFLRSRMIDRELPLRLRLIDVETSLFGAESREVGLTNYRIALLNQGRNQRDDAERYFRAALRILSLKTGESPWEPVTIRARLAGNLRVRKKVDEALRIARVGYDRGVSLDGEESVRLRTIAIEYCKCLRESKRYDEAERLLRKRIAIEVKLAQPLQLMLARNDLAIVLTRANKLDDAQAVFSDIQSADKSKLPPTHWAFGQVHRSCGVFLGKKGEFEAGAAELRSAIDVFRNALGPRHPNVFLSTENLADLYDAWGKPDEAKKLRATITGR